MASGTLLEHLRSLSSVACDTLDVQGKSHVLTPSRINSGTGHLTDLLANVSSGEETRSLHGLHFQSSTINTAIMLFWLGILV